MTPDLKKMVEAMAAEIRRQASECGDLFITRKVDDVITYDGDIDLEAVARAALEAIREPSEEVIAGYDGPGGEAEYGLEKYRGEFLRETLSAVFDQILKSPDEPT